MSNKLFTTEYYFRRFQKAKIFNIASSYILNLLKNYTPLGRIFKLNLVFKTFFFKYPQFLGSSYTLLVLLLTLDNKNNKNVYISTLTLHILCYTSNIYI